MVNNDLQVHYYYWADAAQPKYQNKAGLGQGP
jgi:hypothetical protein